jgi:hypothetical protein
MTDNYHSQRGAVFFYILLAIALLAALSYAVSRGNRGGTSTMTDQQAKLAAQEIIDYGNTVANAVQKLKLRGIQDHEFDFSNNVYKLENGTPWPAVNTTCASNICKLFDAEGGGIQAKYASEIAQIKNVPNLLGSSSGMGGFRTVYIEDIGTDAADLTFDFVYINKEICIKINEILGIENPSGNPPLDNYHGGQGNYAGTINSFPVPPSVVPIGDDVTQLAGKTAFCLSSNPPYYSYKQVVLAR